LSSYSPNNDADEELVSLSWSTKPTVYAQDIAKEKDCSKLTEQTPKLFRYVLTLTDPNQSDYLMQRRHCASRPGLWRVVLAYTHPNAKIKAMEFPTASRTGQIYI